MSLSKEQPVVDAAAQPRRPKCTRCRHHGIIVPQKGHVKLCPFLKCDCCKCFLIAQRTRITALQRNLKKAEKITQIKEAHRPGVAPPAAADGGARSSAAAADDAAAACGPLDLRSRPAAGGGSAAGVDSGKVLPFVSGDEGAARTPRGGPHFSEFGRPAPLPVAHYPFRTSGHFPSSYVPCPNFLLNMPWLPVPAGFHHDVRCAPLIFPHVQLGAVHYPPPPEPGLPAEELMSRQPPLSTERDK